VSADASEPVERAALRTQKIAEFLEAHFGSVEIAETEATEEGNMMLEPAIVVRLDDLEARVGLIDLVVRCSNESLKGRVESILEMAMTTVDSLATSFTAGPQDVDPAVTMMVSSGKDTRSDINGRVSDMTPAGDPLVMPQQHEQEVQDARTDIQATQADPDPDPVPIKDGDRDAAGDENPGSWDASGSDADAEDEEDSMLAVIG